LADFARSTSLVQFPQIWRANGWRWASSRSKSSPIIQRRAKAAGITTRAGNHTFRATGVTAYLKNGGTLERAAQVANHASTRTTQLYDRRAEEVTLDDVERILV
jgi:site-specific recombinase XerD